MTNNLFIGVTVRYSVLMCSLLYLGISNLSSIMRSMPRLQNGQQVDRKCEHMTLVCSIIGYNHNKVYRNCVIHHPFSTVLDTPLSNCHAFIMSFTYVHNQDLAQL